MKHLLRSFLLLSLLLLSAAFPVSAQLGSVPYTFVPGSLISSSQMNANFSNVFTNALNRTGGTMTGVLNTQNILPVVNDTYTLGNTSYRWTKVWAKDADFSGTTTFGTITITTLSCTGCVGPTALASTAVTPGSYGTSTSIASFTVDAQGRLTAAAGVTPQLTISSTYFSSLDGSNLTNVALLNAANTFTSATGQTVKKLLLAGSTSGSVTLAVPATAGSNTLTFPAGTTDFSATGGTSQVIKQTSVGGAFTVAQLAASDLSNGTVGSGTVVLANSASSGKILQSNGTSYVASTPTYPTAAGTSGNVLTSDGTNWTSAAAASGAVSLLYAASGTSTDTSARVIDSYALASQLTSLDTLQVEVTMFNSTGYGVNGLVLYNGTDSVSVGGPGTAATNVGPSVADVWSARISSAGSNPLKVGAVHQFTTGGTYVGVGIVSSFSTNFTGNWTLQLKQTATAGGTLSWSWRIYRVKGQ